MPDDRLLHFASKDLFGMSGERGRGHAKVQVVFGVAY